MEDELKSSTSTQKKLSVVNPATKQTYHTDEFIKRRDEFKQTYKNMNNGIREFFKAMNKEGLDID